MATTLYGIKNCDTVKKAQKFLDKNELTYQFHDFRAQGISPELIQTWLQLVPWETLLNKRSRTYRELPEAIKQSINTDSITALFCEQPTLIKRPVLNHQGQLYIGYTDKIYQEIINHA